mgnify:FL=1
MSSIRTIGLTIASVLPGFLKKAVLRRVFGFKIGRGVRIGISLLDCRQMNIADGTTIGHFNLFWRVDRCEIGDNVRIGVGNIFRGGDLIDVGSYCEILRFNQINAIPDPILVNKAEPTFHLGAGSVIAASHKIDFTGGVRIGKRVVVGGRLSSVWTHNRQFAKPVIIGDCVYLGSDVKVAPGVSIPPRCVIGMGSVVASSLDGHNKLFGGVPARPIKDLDEEGLFLIDSKTRPDLPDSYLQDS